MTRRGHKESFWGADKCFVSSLRNWLHWCVKKFIDLYASDVLQGYP